MSNANSNAISTGVTLSKLCAGRKRESEVWNYFSYDAIKNKSVCLAKLSNASENIIKKCGFHLAGKNPTNLKVINFAMIY